MNLPGFCKSVAIALLLLSAVGGGVCQTAATSDQSTQQSQPGNANRQNFDYPVNKERITNAAGAEDDHSAQKPVAGDASGSAQAPVESAEPPTEFQEFVFQATGQVLPMYGYGVFRNAPSTFAPLDRVPVTNDYTIGPGDELVLRGWGQIDIDYRGTVDRSGQFYIPKVGAVSVAGIKYGDLQPYLKSAIGKYFHDFELTVTLGRLRSIQVFVVGSVIHPGSYTVSSLSTLVNAVFASGGPSKKGSLRDIQLKRGNGAIVSHFDVYELLLNGDKSKDVPLLPGDVIYIPPVGATVALVGSVATPAIYEIKPGATVTDVLRYAGGLTSAASGSNAVIERIKGRSVRTVDDLAFDDSGLAKALQDGDVLTIRPLSARFENAVTLRGNVAAPGRYRWHEGMKIRDLIPTRESLITRQFWSQQLDLGRDARETKGRTNPESPVETSAALSPSAPPSTPAPTNVQSGSKEPGSVRPTPNVGYQEAAINAPTGIIRTTAINWDYAVVQRFDPQTLSTRLLPFNLGKAISGESEVDNLSLEAGDIVTIFSQSDIAVAEGKKMKYVRLEGEFIASGVYEALPGETLPQLVQRVGGFTDRAYLFGAEFTRESNRKIQQQRLDEFVDRLEREVEIAGSAESQNVVSPEEAAGLRESFDTQRRLVDKLRQVKATGRIVLGVGANDKEIAKLPNIELEDGDKFMVPYKPSTVNVVGAVYNNNSFVFRPRRNLNYYLHLAGNGSREADKSHIIVVRADGSVLSRTTSSGWFTGGFDSTTLLPGDTVVVPEKLRTLGVLKGLRDWSLVLGQFALGAAALRTLTQ